jgi:hypothetical protein
MQRALWRPEKSTQRANAGDYLWVISLKDGAALKMPDDVANELKKKNRGHINGDDPWGKTLREVTARFHDCTRARLDHQFLYAQG